MRRAVAVLCAAWLATPVVHADALQVRHAALTCFPAERYVRLSAEAVPPDGATSADVQFRSGPDAAWYAVEMERQDTRWAALLPRPQRSLHAFEYRIAMRSAAGEESATPVIGVSVEPPDVCRTPSVGAIEETLRVRVPAGAPITPPVPQGFDPAGAVSTRELEPAKSHRGIAVAAVAGVAGAAAVFGITGRGNEHVTPEPEAPLDIPDFNFVRALPEPGATLSLHVPQLMVFLELSHLPVRLFAFNWTIDLFVSGTSCQVRMEGQYILAGDRPGVILGSPLAPLGTCGEAFDVDDARLVVVVQGNTVAKLRLPLHYHVER